MERQSGHKPGLHPWPSSSKSPASASAEPSFPLESSASASPLRLLAQPDPESEAAVRRRCPPAAQPKSKQHGVSSKTCLFKINFATRLQSEMRPSDWQLAENRLSSVLRSEEHTSELQSLRHL